MAIIPVRFRFVNADKTVRLNCDSDSEGIRVQKGIVLGATVPSYDPLRAPGTSGMEPTGRFDPEVEMIVPVRLAKQASMDAAIATWDAFAQELRRDGKIEFRPPSATGSYWIDFYASPVPSLWGGYGGFDWWEHSETVEPILISITRHPEIQDDLGNTTWL